MQRTSQRCEGTAQFPDSSLVFCSRKGLAVVDRSHRRRAVLGALISREPDAVPAQPVPPAGRPNSSATKSLLLPAKSGSCQLPPPLWRTRKTPRALPGYGGRLRTPCFDRYLVLFDSPLPGAAAVDADGRETFHLPTGRVVRESLKREKTANHKTSERLQLEFSLLILHEALMKAPPGPAAPSHPQRCGTGTRVVISALKQGTAARSWAGFQGWGVHPTHHNAHCCGQSFREAWDAQNLCLKQELGGVRTTPGSFLIFQ